MLAISATVRGFFLVAIVFLLCILQAGLSSHKIDAEKYLQNGFVSIACLAIVGEDWCSSGRRKAWPETTANIGIGKRWWPLAGPLPLPRAPAATVEQVLAGPSRPRARACL